MYLHMFYIKKKEEIENIGKKMKRDNKARREVKRHLLYIYTRNFFFLSSEKKKKQKKNEEEREGDKFLSTYQKLSFFFL